MNSRLLVLAAVLLAAPSSALATHSTVPDDYPTIQAALDCHLDLPIHFVDTVFVRGGYYPEALKVDGFIACLLAMPGDSIMPMAISISWVYSDMTVRGFAFTGPVGSPGGRFERCRFEAGLTFGVGSSYVADCLIYGDLSEASGTFTFERDTVIGGTISVDPVGLSFVRRCVVLGPAAVGIRLWTDAYAEDNYVRNCETGISLNAGYNAARRNVVEDCSGTGMVVDGRGYVSSGATNNTIRRCGGDGMRVTEGHPWVSGNMVDSVGGTGIYAHTAGTAVMGNTVTNAGGIGMDLASSDGPYYEASPLTVVGNRVIGSASDGVVVNGGTARVLGNVVGRSGGRGLVATGENVTLRSNTLYLNADAGLELSGNSAAAVDTVDHNIAYQNGTGLRWLGPGVGLLGCNDWYANMSANTEGISLGATDVSLDPFFCSLGDDDVHLAADSPLLAMEGCGLIGALGQGCQGALQVGFSLSPSVLNLRSKGRWVTGRLQPPAPYAASDIVVGSIRVNGTVPVDSLGPVALGDLDGDGMGALEVKFDRAALELTLSAGDTVRVTVQGTVAGQRFSGTTVIRVLGARRGTASEREDLAQPVAVLTTSLQNVSPNPVRGAPVVHLTLADSRPATLALYDVSGRLVSSQEIAGFGAGTHQLTLGRGGNLSPGIYLIRLTQGGGAWVRRVVVLE